MSGPALLIGSVGPGTTIQDEGRVGLLRFGVTPAGPMDRAAFHTANLALGNRETDAALEIATGGIALRSEAPIALAFAGGGFRWNRDDQVLPAAARVTLRPGETLRARAGAHGAWCYLAVPGGIDCPETMGSRATHVRSRIGGFDGRALSPGDRLGARAASPDLDDVEIHASRPESSDAPLRLILGPQDDHFVPNAITRLFAEDWTLTSAADRMAYRFAGPKLDHARDFNIVSDGVALGAIQVAGDGQPMVLMADRQPTGGYPKIAHVCRADIGRLAQMRPGDVCRFVEIDVAVARRAQMALDRAIATPRLAPLRRMPPLDRLLGANLIGGVTDGCEL